MNGKNKLIQQHATYFLNWILICMYIYYQLVIDVECVERNFYSLGVHFKKTLQTVVFTTAVPQISTESFCTYWFFVEEIR